MEIVTTSIAEAAVIEPGQATDQRSKRRQRYTSGVELTQAKLRCALTNGTAVLAGVDHRLGWMRRLRDLIDLHEVQLGGAISEAERRVVHYCAMLQLQTEMMEADWADNAGKASGNQFDRYLRTSATQAKLLTTLGLKQRGPKPIRCARSDC
jgi:hypothetical protein